MNWIYLKHSNSTVFHKASGVNNRTWNWGHVVGGIRHKYVIIVDVTSWMYFLDLKFTIPAKFFKMLFSSSPCEQILICIRVLFFWQELSFCVYYQSNKVRRGYTTNNDENKFLRKVQSIHFWDVGWMISVKIYCIVKTGSGEDWYWNRMLYIVSCTKYQVLSTKYMEIIESLKLCTVLAMACSHNGLFGFEKLFSGNLSIRRKNKQKKKTRKFYLKKAEQHQRRMMKSKHSQMFFCHFFPFCFAKTKLHLLMLMLMLASSNIFHLIWAVHELWNMVSDKYVIELWNLRFLATWHMI